ncbi:MAG: RNA polymerase sigma factor [Planctomycetota bacterium]|jgi:RNA polymerase sigma factor (sigma-70 family)
MGENVKLAIDAVLGGRIEAYAEVVRAYQSDVWRVAAYALRDVSTTEDLVQQVFVYAYMSLESYDADRDFGVRLRSIARNLVRNEIRRSARTRGAQDLPRERREDYDGEDTREAVARRRRCTRGRPTHRTGVAVVG